MWQLFGVASLFAETLCPLEVRYNSLVDSKKAEELVWRGVISSSSLVGGTLHYE